MNFSNSFSLPSAYKIPAMNPVTFNGQVIFKDIIEVKEYLCPLQELVHAFGGRIRTVHVEVPVKTQVSAVPNHHASHHVLSPYLAIVFTHCIWGYKARRGVNVFKIFSTSRIPLMRSPLMPSTYSSTSTWTATPLSGDPISRILPCLRHRTNFMGSKVPKKSLRGALRKKHLLYRYVLGNGVVPDGVYFYWETHEFCNCMLSSPCVNNRKCYVLEKVN
ncbi:hypothetical protein CHITON_0144 [Thermococcus chitonophagus]|uniref:Uncharacterized protein n=1 Tax=Thermococcus chitonophagus TaxID=54262 RepID=A0A160VQ11_9EURY|nr:hypothetical protein CHITON_0144 [Thermococcus chitonophagus]